MFQIEPQSVKAAIDADDLNHVVMQQAAHADYADQFFPIQHVFDAICHLDVSILSENDSIHATVPAVCRAGR